MKVVIHQSNYLPWKGYFDLIHDADVFVFLDDVKFTKNDWRNRNRIMGATGPYWLTIPVGAQSNRRICDVALPDGKWRLRHWRSLQQSYARAPYFSRYADFFESLYTEGEWTTLSELNRYLIETISREFLGISTRFCSSTELGSTGRNQDRVINLLETLRATHYISGPAGRTYLDEKVFDSHALKLVWKDYRGYPAYPQLHRHFIHQVSIVDLLFCAGPAAPEYIWGWRRATVPMLQ